MQSNTTFQLEQEIIVLNQQIDGLAADTYAKDVRIAELERQVAELRTAQPVVLTDEHVRAAGGIVHKDGNIFFTNIGKLNAAILAAKKQVPTEAENQPITAAEWDSACNGLGGQHANRREYW